MALRAGYYGLKRVIKDKLLNLANAAPADISPDNPIASKGDVLATVDLMKDTTGWLGGNKCPFHSQTIGGFQFVADNEGYITCGSSDTREYNYNNSNEKFTLKAGTYKIKLFAKTVSTEGWVGFTIYDSSDNALFEASSTGQFNDLVANGATLTLQNNTNVGVTLKVGNGAYAVMIIDEAEYALNPAYRPYHENVEEYAFSRSEQAVLGATNLLPIEANKDIKVTVGSVNYTFNVDSNYYMSCSDADTRDESSIGIIYTNSQVKFNLPKGDYIWKIEEGTPNTGSALRFSIVSSTTRFVNQSEAGEFSFSLSEDTALGLFAKVRTGSYRFSIIPVGFKNIPFVPYSMTNRELTENKVDKNVKTLTSLDDLNNITETGFYSVSTAPSNSPEGLGYYELIVGKRSDDNIQQMIIRTNNIYTRAYGSSQWSAWYKFTGTEVTLPSPTPENETKKATKKKVIKEEE